ncbi:hypothetical protein HPB49_010677 [Dermacentor silvarum]|uniref:Uncharacterized protein n=1 Tax=Dermacentor silvarum TaxID=543639 RepID=A0ACB8DZK5_DERSI|nr:hypothetical protein HPB49_010677 [Dermacentor silvarum]
MRVTDSTRPFDAYLVTEPRGKCGLCSSDGCSSRSTPKPRPPQSTVRPNITFQTYTCPETYAKWYCLNGATCFSIKIGESILYNCECADGYMGQRCEFKDLDGTYLPTRQRVLIETASIAGGVTVAVILVFIVCVTVYLYYRRRKTRHTLTFQMSRSSSSATGKTTAPQPQLVLRQSVEAMMSEKPWKSNYEPLQQRQVGDSTANLSVHDVIKAPLLTFCNNTQLCNGSTVPPATIWSAIFANVVTSVPGPFLATAASDNHARRIVYPAIVRGLPQTKCAFVDSGDSTNAAANFVVARNNPPHRSKQVERHCKKLAPDSWRAVPDLVYVAPPHSRRIADLPPAEKEAWYSTLSRRYGVPAFAQDSH